MQYHEILDICTCLGFVDLTYGFDGDIAVKYDDSTVRPIVPSKALEEAQKDCYVLHYKLTSKVCQN